jgi:TldD protein
MSELRHQTPDPDLLRQVLARASAGRRFSEADIFAERKSTLRIDLLDGRVVVAAQGLEEGAAVRTAGPAGCRFEYTDGLDEASLHRLAAGRTEPGTSCASGTELENLDTAPLLGALVEISAAVHRNEPACRRVEVTCYAVRQQVWIIDEQGGCAVDRRSAFRVSARVLAGQSWGMAHHGAAWTAAAFDPEQARRLAHHACSAARSAAGAGPVTTGLQTVVLAAGSGGILLHEACGHLLEADYVLPGLSPFAGRMGQTVASPLVSAVDDPTLPGLPASQLVDDEGVPAARKLLLDRGVLTSFLCGRRESASGGAGFRPGNARRRSFRHQPLPRMSNTMILAGETPPEDVIGQTARGIYAARLSAGQADPASGRFRFTVAEGSLIEEGKLTRPLDGGVISGTGPAALAAVDLVGTDAAVDPTAAGCTKGGQTIPVSVGHPTLRLRSLMVEPLHDAGEGRP